ncbi:MAG: tRNA uridine-5-carboxymethylaminomethyl(34) synthesis enzyme MnmG [Clostridia bacterium]|nr:tRNA uridine-5-carboxymethylaminomethyl(34) synthesis enzyme MnmG [Clostridia bacterium]
MKYQAGEYEAAVIGLGHAGIEAALALARLGVETLAFTINLDSVGNMPCNPAIGGTAKGHLVRELDALGGEMGKAADDCCIEYRMLNRGKGPAVYSLRGQIDRVKYRERMKGTLEKEKHLHIVQAEVVSLETEDGKVTSVTTRAGAVYKVKACVICTGTYLEGKVIMGELSYESGPDGLFPSRGLSASLAETGHTLRRFKTGTPPRINRNTVDFSRMEVQEGDKDIEPFSFSTTEKKENKAVCHLVYTNAETHRIIRENLDRSPLFSGAIEGIGPRYCPSIEDKVVRFADKERHQLFVEPMGLNTDELYLQGFSSSMPEEIQLRMLHSLEGMEHAHVQRSAYAIEYDCVDPRELYPTLESKLISGLYGAGQFNGSSGYEEAAVQGFVAGVNAARKIKGQEAFVLLREDGYIGTLIDDLTDKGTNEPYRMMTSRSEYRLFNRQDNADQRLMGVGHDLGLVSDETYEAMLEKYRVVDKEIRRLETTGAKPDEEIFRDIAERTGGNVNKGVKLADLLRRPGITYEELASLDPERPSLPHAVTEEAEIAIKYDGYIKREREKVEKVKRLSIRTLPEDMDYMSVATLRLEARQKLQKIRPKTIGEASRISGVSPADISVLLLYTKESKDEHYDR